jgi:hypothetical protein
VLVRLGIIERTAQGGLFCRFALMFIAMYLGTALGRTNDHNTSHSILSRGWLDQTAKLRWPLKK